MDIRPIEDDAGLRHALSRIDVLWNSKAKSEKAAAELKVWSVLVEDYERRNHPIPPPSPIEAIRFRMDQLELKTIDMAEYFGTRGRASEVLSGKRLLTLTQIRKLNSGLGIPAEILIRVPRRRPTRAKPSAGIRVSA